MSLAERIGQKVLSADIDDRARTFVHVVRWLMLGKGNTGNAIMAAQANRAQPKIVEALKAAQEAGSTSVGNWGAPLAGAFVSLADGWLASLRNYGLFDASLPFTKQIPLNSSIVLTSVGTSATSKGEGQSKIISKLQLSSATLEDIKAAAIVVASEELLKVGAVAGKLFGEELRRAVIAETDNKFLSEITTGISTTASGGSNAFGIAADMAALLGGLTLGGDSKVFIAMAPGDVKHMAVQIANNGERAFPTVSISGGEYAGATIIPSDQVSGQIVAWDATQLAAADNGIAIDTSNQASIMMDSAPNSPQTAGDNVTSLTIWSERERREPLVWSV